MKKPSEFKNQKEFLKYLVENKRELISFKKAALKFSDSCSMPDELVDKAMITNFKDDIANGVIKRSIIANTYNWMDSHDDVHLDGVFSKSISENQDNIRHLHDHEYKITAKVGKPVAIYEKSILWHDLGVQKNGRTEALMMDSNIQKNYNPQVFDQYLNKEINQHSVGMKYVNLDLAVNDPNMKAEYAVWNKYIGRIGNADKAEAQGYFWAVKEANLKEISAVLAGSNSLTPTMDNEDGTMEDVNCTETSTDINGRGSITTWHRGGGIGQIPVRQSVFRPRKTISEIWSSIAEEIKH